MLAGALACQNCQNILFSALAYTQSRASAERVSGLRRHRFYTIDFFASGYELYLYTEASETLRDLLNRMDKAGLIGSVSLWIEMRDLRNQVVHDYVSEHLKEFYDLITGRLGQESMSVGQKASALEFAIS